MTLDSFLYKINISQLLSSANQLIGYFIAIFSRYFHLKNKSVAQLCIDFLSKTIMRKVNSEPQSGREAILALKFTRLINPHYLAGIYFMYCLSFNLNGQKVNGMSFSSPQYPTLELGTFENLKSIPANWIALIPEATLDRTTLQLLSDDQNHWWGETIEANIQAIKLAKQAGLKVFVKPHIVLSAIPSTDQTFVRLTDTRLSYEKKKTDKTKGAEWRGTLKVRNERDWKILEKSYEIYILKLAEVAATLEVDLFSVGTELGNFTSKRLAFWLQLIQKVKTIYTGPLVYCANWDEYDKITFWSVLDYIGVDTYFPINKMKTPSIKKTLKKWRPIRKQLKRLSKQFNKQILLTEFGYRNVPFAGKRPWTHDKGPATINNEAQQNLYSAFFQTFWDKNWVAGGFAWKWFSEPKKERATSFSIQGKPAMTELTRWYAKG